MTTLTIELDDRAAENLRTIAATEGTVPDEMAARLLRRAILRARVRTPVDREALRAYIAEEGENEVALAESGVQERADLLAAEDAA
jgi:hypothetical protein